MGKILVVVEQREGRLRGTAAEVVSAASELAVARKATVEVLLPTGPGGVSDAEALGAHGAEVIEVVSDPALATYHPDGFARLVERRVRSGGYDVVLMAATAQGKDLGPRVAALLDVPLAQDVTAIESVDGEVEFLRPVYAGKAIARVAIDADPKVATLRPNVFQPASRPAAGGVVEGALDDDSDGWPTRVVGFEESGGDIPDVAEAGVVVSGGRGLKGPEHWEILEELRSALGEEAGLGASRAVVDAGWRPHSEQVGQTGKTVSPRLYFAIGISGAIQHLAGMRTAGTIVAVNKDPDAPIFKVADYGIVGDLFEVVPRLTEEIRALRERSA
ncbi:MAG: electron transfer flavoprotein subunit alpha/FixB family protein [Gemmatimonadota bacterium]